ncbi:hypothetical protein LQW54_003274 [Pestalotiopsis sp. IQ-011]
MDQFYLENADLYQKLLKGLKPPRATAAKTAAVASDAKMIVGARIRPMLEEDLSSSYQMDRVYGSELTTETIYKDLVADLIPLAWRGGTGSLFAYGQTGSGKTFTISRLEILVINSLLGQNDSDNDEGRKRRIYMTIVELAGNSAFDLLSARKSVMVLEDAAGATQLFGAREQLIGDKREAALLLRAANRLRRAAPTSKNDGSSRSHAICRVRVEDPSSEAAGFLYLVDLAGSEVARDIAAHTADRMRETREINTSLSVLKDCIRGRAEWEATKRSKRGRTRKRPHIPFRHCALTKVLKHVFDPSDDRDDSRTVVIACVNPNLADAKSSKNTLRYAEMLRVPVPAEENPKTDIIAQARILSSQDLNPAAASVPFNERIRPGMVVTWKRPDTEKNAALAPDQSLAIALCPSVVLGTGPNSVRNEEENSLIPDHSGSETDQNGKGEKWLCAQITPGAAAGSYEVNIWQQLDIDVSWMVSEVILRCDTNTRYYHVVE